MSKNIAVLIGSASKTSFNHAVVRHLQNNVPAGIQLNILDIADLPLYDRDLDEQNVVAYHRFREAIKSADGFLWVSPEHNGQVSAMLKNA
ncbi:MAG: NAD(P)H-dependent oxidoreductase, partial [Alysiella sp.]|uniref:NADPH-dependent FMN reductase n=1 Tax=Alysiella sp. TaxID=1872483 RepID=UPI0026DC5F58